MLQPPSTFRWWLRLRIVRARLSAPGAHQRRVVEETADTQPSPARGAMPGGGGMALVVLIAAVVVVALVAFASGYGYHRDELYFLAAGRHLAWSYADQGPLTPLIARVMSEIAPDSLTVLRLPSAFAAATTVLLTGLLARELGAGRRGQPLAAACAAVGVMVLFDGHLLSTSTFDLLCWTTVSWLVVRAVRAGQDRLWLVAGVVLGVGLLNKPLPAFLAAGLLVAVVVAGPRRLLRNPFVWTAAAIAVALWSPWLIWQTAHHWPQIAVSRSIAAGNSTSSTPWWQIVPFQVLLVGPLVAARVDRRADPDLPRPRRPRRAFPRLGVGPLGGRVHGHRR